MRQPQNGNMLMWHTKPGPFCAEFSTRSVCNFKVNPNLSFRVSCEIFCRLWNQKLPKEETMSHLNNPVGLLNDKARTAESAQKEDEEYDTMIEKIITKITASDGEIAAISQYADQMMGS